MGKEAFMDYNFQNLQFLDFTLKAIKVDLSKWSV